jgi:hypothetical protein
MSLSIEGEGDGRGTLANVKHQRKEEKRTL